MKKISADDLVNQGRSKFVNRPLIFAFGLIPINFFLSIFLRPYINEEILEYDFLFPFFSFSIPLLVAFIYVQYNIGPWRIWAYKNVDNKHAFHRKALEQKIFSSASGSFFMSQAQKEQLREIELLLRTSKEKTSKSYLPKNHKVCYYNSRFWIIIHLLFLVPFTFLGLFSYFDLDADQKYTFENILLLLGCLIGLFLISKNIIRLLDRKPKLTLDKNGIKESNQKVIRWNEFSTAKIKRIGHKNSKEVLELTSNKKVKHINLDRLSINHSEISDFLTYHGK
ncbi:hypothetical protein [Flammeovirga sp. SJP92]|uniref:hypothetical protein n=1 Tax=Flammeovirga sp. SJP92 TaxID=1775430 RepID=UPI0007899F9C|nr:hypothetical protein [Flammeovirga sp. SJP92]KXX71137.1 hypothetical protein AVL50_09910 [Flammeovirga sp. SJP92]